MVLCASAPREADRGLTTILIYYVDCKYAHIYHRTCPHCHSLVTTRLTAHIAHVGSVSPPMPFWLLLGQPRPRRTRPSHRLLVTCPTPAAARCRSHVPSTRTLNGPVAQPHASDDPITDGALAIMSTLMASAEEVLDEAPLFFIFCTMVTTMTTTTATAKPTAPARPGHQTWSGTTSQ